MNTKSFFFLVIFIAVITGSYYLLKNQSFGNKVQKNITQNQTEIESTLPAEEKNTPSQTEDNQSNTVDYNDDGFTPKDITIKVNSMVTWVNKSSKLMWVASAVHPTHQELPGFDALVGFEKDESYSYTFTKLGKWRYHDHLTPTMFGSVTVEE